MSVEAPTAPRRAASAGAGRRHRLALRLTAAAGIWSGGLVLAALLVPAYDGETVSAAAGVTLARVTLVQHDGWPALLYVALPAIASLLVLAALVLRRPDGRDRSGARPRARTWLRPAASIVTAGLTIESLLTIASLGAFLLPVAVLLALALRLSPARAA